MRIYDLAASIGRCVCRTAFHVATTVPVVGVVAGGLAFAGQSDAANLIINGSFEQNNGFNGDNSGFDWTTVQGDDTSLGFDVYSHTTQVYYSGLAPAGSGDWYFHTVGLGSLTTTAVIVEQQVNVSGVIGQPFDFSAQIAGFGAGGDTATLNLIFDDAATTTVVLDGTTGGADGITNTCNEFSEEGVIPADATTATIQILQATARSSNGNDNYVDLVSLFVGTNDPAPKIVIDRDTGEISIANNTGSPLNFRGYAIESADGALVSSNWDSIAGTRDGSTNGDASVDDDAWVRFSDTLSKFELSEGSLDVATLANGDSITLSTNEGGPGPWLEYYKDGDKTDETVPT